MGVVDVERDALKQIVHSLVLRVDAIDEVFVPPANDNLEKVIDDFTAMAKFHKTPLRSLIDPIQLRLKP